MSNDYDFSFEEINAFTLTVAYYLTKNNKKVLLIKNNSPESRLYSENKWNEYCDNYVNFLNLLKAMELNFHDYFICLKNQNTFNKFYCPKLPLDQGLYRDWLNKITNTGNCTIIEKPINKNCQKKNITIAFHWKNKYDLINDHSNTLSLWNTKFIVLTDYMFLNNSESVTVIQTVIDDVDLIPEDYQYDNVIDSVFNELKNIFVNLPEPTSIVFNINKLNDNDQKNIEQQVIKGSTYINGLHSFEKIQLFRPDDIEGIFKFLFLIGFLYSLFSKVI